MKRNGDKNAMLVVYVDDIVNSRNYEKGIKDLKSYLGNEFETKDVEELKYFLGIKMAMSKKGIVTTLCQYTLDLLEETGK